MENTKKLNVTMYGFYILVTITVILAILIMVSFTVGITYYNGFNNNVISCIFSLIFILFYIYKIKYMYISVRFNISFQFTIFMLLNAFEFVFFYKKEVNFIDSLCINNIVRTNKFEATEIKIQIHPG